MKEGHGWRCRNMICCFPSFGVLLIQQRSKCWFGLNGATNYKSTAASVATALRRTHIWFECSAWWPTIFFLKFITNQPTNNIERIYIMIFILRLPDSLQHHNCQNHHYDHNHHLVTIFTIFLLRLSHPPTMARCKGGRERAGPNKGDPFFKNIFVMISW